MKHGPMARRCHSCTRASEYPRRSIKLRYQLCAALALALFILPPFLPPASGGDRRGASAQPPVPHPVEGRDDCLACHQAGTVGAPRVAADHVGRTNETCGQCHRPIGIEPAAVRPVPHPVEGREECLACHESGVGGASQVPDDHAGRANETCGQCHVVANTPDCLVITSPAVAGQCWM